MIDKSGSRLSFLRESFVGGFTMLCYRTYSTDLFHSTSRYKTLTAVMLALTLCHHSQQWQTIFFLIGPQKVHLSVWNGGDAYLVCHTIWESGKVIALCGCVLVACELSCVGV